MLSYHRRRHKNNIYSGGSATVILATGIMAFVGSLSDLVGTYLLNIIKYTVERHLLDPPLF